MRLSIPIPFRPRASAAALAIVPAALALAGCREAEPAAAEAPPPTVSVATPIGREITDFERYPGRVASPETVEVRPRVNGYLTEVYFTDGQEVEEGAPLYQIDPRPYQAALDRSLAEVERLKAQLELADIQQRRAEQLLRRNAGTREEFDTAVANFSVAQAGLAAAEAQVVADRLDLEFTEVAAPIAGRVSRTLVTVGNVVSSAGADGGTLLTTIVSVDPMYIYFNVDERAFQRYQRETLARTGVTSRVDVATAEIPVLAGLVTDEGYPLEGAINFGDNRLDPGTGTISVRGVFPNPNRLLVPGEFARIRLRAGEPYRALLVPERAIGTDQGRKFLLVVDRDGAVQHREVTLGTLTDDEFRVIAEGIGPDDRVIVNGMLRVRPGMTVQAEEVTPEGGGADPAAEELQPPPIIPGGSPGATPPEVPSPVATPPEGAPPPSETSPAPSGAADAPEQGSPSGAAPAQGGEAP